MSDSNLAKSGGISVVGYADDMDIDRDRDGDEDRGFFSRRKVVRQVVDVKKVEDEVKAFMGAMERIIGNLSNQVGNYSMETITVSAEVSAKGTVSLLGTGGEMGAKGGLSFSFKRSTGSSGNQGQK